MALQFLPLTCRMLERKGEPQTLAEVGDAVSVSLPYCFGARTKIVEIIIGHGVQEDPSGVGHAWRAISVDSLTVFPASIAEEIACWIIEDQPEPGEEMTASNGQHYRVPLA